MPSRTRITQEEINRIFSRMYNDFEENERRMNMPNISIPTASLPEEQLESIRTMREANEYNWITTYTGSGIPAVTTSTPLQLSPITRRITFDVPSTPNALEAFAIPNTAEEVRNILQKFVASKGLHGAEGLVRCGLEFEFHKLNTPNSHILDIAAYESDREKYFSAANLITLFRHHRDRTLDYETFREIWDYLYYDNFVSIEKLPKKLQKWARAWLTILTERAQTHWETSQKKVYTGKASTSDIVGWNAISNYTQLGEDGSVRGGEIRTTGPRSIREFMRTAYTLSKAPFEVDVDTSFHIHLSVAGVQHKWGARFQAEMYAYLLSNLDRLPQPIRTRLLAEKGGAKYAKFSIRNGHKYSAIYQNDEYNTWEFRLFGNITSHRDMVKCLSLAIDTLRHAYKVKLGGAPSLLANYGMDQINFALDAIYNNPKAPEVSEDDPRYDGPSEDEEDADRTYPVRPARSFVRNRGGVGIGPEEFWSFIASNSEVIRAIEESAA